MWKDEIKKSMEEGGLVDDNNPVHVTVEQILKEHGYGEKAEQVIERLKLRMKWLDKHAEYGERD